MMKRLLRLLVLALLLAGCQGLQPIPHARPTDPANANPVDVSLNGVGLPDPPPQPYQILVAGHLYGTIQGEDRLPAKALLGRIPALKENPPGMLVSLGDMVKVSKKEDFDELDRKLLRQLPFAMFNVPGNHDVEEDRALYEARYGQTFYSFSYGPARLVFLDTERENCAIDQAQVEMLQKALQDAREDAGTKNILIFMHKTLFFTNPRLHELQKNSARPNAWECYGSHSFAEIMQNILRPTAAIKPLYLFAGDVGAWGNLTPYYEKSSDANITMVMTGLGDSDNDAGILVTVDGEQVRLEVYPLTDQASPPLETFTPEYWVTQAEGQ
jgi:hypothetical protein